MLVSVNEWEDMQNHISFETNNFPPINCINHHLQFNNEFTVQFINLIFNLTWTLHLSMKIYFIDVDFGAVYENKVISGNLK